MKFDADIVKHQYLDESYRFYQQRFSNAATFNFSFVGNADFLQMEMLLSNYIASLPTIAKKDKATVFIHFLR
jgi:zinc protease